MDANTIVSGVIVPGSIPDQLLRAVQALRFRLITSDILVDEVVRALQRDRILATALSGRADYLVTGDRQLQQLGTYRTVAIVSPRAFLDLLNEQRR